MDRKLALSTGSLQHSKGYGYFYKDMKWGGCGTSKDFFPPGLSISCISCRARYKSMTYRVYEIMEVGGSGWICDRNHLFYN